MRSLIPLLLVAVVLLLCGCGADDLKRAQTYANQAHAALDYATQHVDALQAQLDAAKQALAASGDEKVAAVVQQLEASVTVAKRSLPAIQAAASQADQSLAQLKAQAAEGVIPWWKVAIGIIVPIALPLVKEVPGVGPLIGQLGELAWNAYATSQQKAQQQTTEQQAAALQQTVVGIDAAKAKLNADAVNVLHTELAKAQDGASKDAVDQVQAQAA